MLYVDVIHLDKNTETRITGKIACSWSHKFYLSLTTYIIRHFYDHRENLRHTEHYNIKRFYLCNMTVCYIYRHSCEDALTVGATATETCR